MEGQDILIGHGYGNGLGIYINLARLRLAMDVTVDIRYTLYVAPAVLNGRPEQQMHNPKVFVEDRACLFSLRHESCGRAGRYTVDGTCLDKSNHSKPTSYHVVFAVICRRSLIHFAIHPLRDTGHFLS